MSQQKLTRKKATELLSRAADLVARGQPREGRELAQQVIDSGAMGPSPLAHVLVVDALIHENRQAEAMGYLEALERKHPNDPTVGMATAWRLVQQGRLEQGLAVYARIRPQKNRDPEFLTAHATALLQAGRTEEAERETAVALLSGGGLPARLMLACCKARRGRIAEAEELSHDVETRTKDESLRFEAMAFRAQCLTLRGDAAAALAVFERVEAAGKLTGSPLAHAASAAAAANQLDRANDYIRRRVEEGADASDLLVFADIANSQNQPTRALEYISTAQTAPGATLAGWAFDMLAARGKALRLLGRNDEARAALNEALLLPESQIGPFGARVFTELGHLAASVGDFETADTHFNRSVSLDPNDLEARRAKDLSASRVAWRESVRSSADAQVEAARAEAESLKKRFVARESEIDALKREIERLKQSNAHAEARIATALEDTEAVKARAEAEQQRAIKAELAAREAEADEAATKALTVALSPHRDRCPEPIWQVLFVAERTYQRAKFTDVPAAAVAMLFSGALERGLYILFVSRLSTWLDSNRLRAEFLEQAVRERRGSRVEYFDNFVAAFDPAIASHAPSLGEMARVFQRRHESYLSVFAEFLREGFVLEDAQLDALATFVQWAKEHLRDPVAHGHGLDISWAALKTLRETLLTNFNNSGRGLMATLLEAQR